MNAGGLALAALLAIGSLTPAWSASVVVTDGDSLDLDGKHVEIWGIIAPSKSETCTTQAGTNWPCGERAFEQLSEAAKDESFACEEKEAGFVICRAGGLDIGMLLVKEGLARSRQDYKDVESRAREAKVGVWE
jgi:endonuclease YncB( thermonuclease family)